MKKIRNLLLVLTALFSMAFLAGCEKSAQIGTTLTFDKDVKGERAMHVELSKESFAENVSGSMEDIQAIFTEKCPKELTYEFSEAEGSYVVDIHLAFDSEEDYYEKVQAVTQKEEPGSITVSDSVFNSGIMVSENFESKDLLGWLSDALLEKQLVKADNESYIFDNSRCIVKYGEKEYEAGSRISINETQSTALSGIEVKTGLNLDGTWNREVSFFVPKDSMDANGDAIKEFLEEGVAKGANGSWEDYKKSGEKGQVYTISVENAQAETLEKLMQAAFHSKDNKVAENTEDSSNGTNLISSSLQLDETYDLSEFVSGNYSNFNLEYIVVTGKEEKQESYPIYNGECSVSRRFSTFLLPSGINLTSKVTGTKDYSRTFEFTFQNLQDEEKNFLKKQAEGFAKDLGKVKIKDKKDAYTLTITVKGDKEKTGKLYEKIFGNELDCTYIAEHKWMGFSNTFAYEEDISLNGFLPAESGESVDVNYELSFGAGAKVKSRLENAFEKKGNTLYLSGSTSSGIHVSLYGTRINLRGIISTVLLLLALICLAFFVILLLSGKKKDKKTQAPAAQEMQPQMQNQMQAPGQPVQPAPIQQQAQPQEVSQPAQPQPAPAGQTAQQEQELPEFCINCGTKFEDAEQMFCSNCGKKRGE